MQHLNGRMRKLRLPCPTCRGHRLLAIGKDQVECPTCEGQAVFEIVEHAFRRPPRRMLVTDTYCKVHVPERIS